MKLTTENRSHSRSTFQKHPVFPTSYLAANLPGFFR
jgi:hypothetical protein